MVKYVIREESVREDEEKTVELYFHRGSDGEVSVKAKGGTSDQHIFTFRTDGSVKHWNYLDSRLGLKLTADKRILITT